MYTDAKAYSTCSPLAVCPRRAMTVPMHWVITRSCKRMGLPGLAHGKHSEVLAAVSMHWLL